MVDSMIAPFSHFNPRRPCRRRRSAVDDLGAILEISIHAAREGGDASMDPFTANDLGFQSTPPVKAATKNPLSLVHRGRNFNPRRP